MADDTDDAPKSRWPKRKLQSRGFTKGAKRKLPSRQLGKGKARRSEKQSTDDPPLDADAAPQRVAKVIARAGVASRRDAERLIAEGRVEVNGERLTSPAITVTADDRISVDGKAIGPRPATRLWLYHKPRGLVVTNRDPEGRPTIFQALPADMPRVVSIGRLDLNTEGLLLLTNDGGLARILELPSTGWTRRYRVRAYGLADEKALEGLKDGVTIGGTVYRSIEAVIERRQGDNLWLTVSLREGKNREVKHVMDHIGLKVNRLIRTSYGPFQLGELASGEVREVKRRVLRDQLGAKLRAESGAALDPEVDRRPERDTRPRLRVIDGGASDANRRR